MPKSNSAATPPKLSDLEWEILKPLWKHGPMAARDIFQAVSPSNDWAYKTVKTMLARLVKKGALKYDQVGNSYLYRPAFSQKTMTREATGAFVRRVFDGAMTPFLAHFAHTASPEELASLRQELAELEEKNNAPLEDKS